MFLGYLVRIDYVYNLKIKEWSAFTLHITFIFITAGNRSGIFEKFDTRLKVGFSVLT